MPRDALTRLQTSNDAVWRQASRDLDAFIRAQDLRDPAAVGRALFEYIPALTYTYGDMAATVAADWFEEFKDDNGGPAKFTAQLSDPAPEAQVKGRLGYLVREGGPVDLADTIAFGKFLRLMVNEYVMDPGHRTIADNSMRSGGGWARVPEAGACEFCLMLASRGFVYDKSTVGDLVKFHGDCRCHGMPVWDESRARQKFGYDPDALYEKYKAGTLTEDSPTA